MPIVQNFDGPGSVLRAHYGDTPYVAPRVSSILPGGIGSRIPGITYSAQTFNPPSGASTFNTFFTTPAKGGELLAGLFVCLAQAAANGMNTNPAMSFKRLDNTGTPQAYASSVILNQNTGTGAAHGWGIFKAVAGDTGIQLVVAATNPLLASNGVLLLMVGPQITTIPDTPNGGVQVGSNTAVVSSSAGTRTPQPGLGFFAVDTPTNTSDSSFFSVPASGAAISIQGPTGFSYVSFSGSSAFITRQMSIADATANGGATVTTHTSLSQSTGGSITNCLAYH